MFSAGANILKVERRGALVGRNIPGNKFQPIFEAGAEYFR